MERKKINLFQQHFANVDTDFLNQFYYLTGIINIISYIKEAAFNDFSIYLDSKEDLKRFEELLKENFYKDKTEWLREKMRKTMNEKKKSL